MLFLNACAGGAPEIGFINQTRHTDAQLWALWHAAQATLAQQIDLNPLQQSLYGAAPQILPGDSRARNVLPQQLVISPRTDVASDALFAATGMQRANPTGLIACPQPCNVSFTPAYSLYFPSASHYAASWEFSGNNFDFLVEYEFENQILAALGYDLRWR